jgi:uncharacterized damage-inducible protein DinB
MPDVLDELLKENAKARADLLDMVDSIPMEQRLEPSIHDWSVRDILVNIAAWQDGWGHALELIAQGERPRVPGFEDNDIDAFNAMKQREAADESWEQTMARLREARERHEAAVRGLRVLNPERYEPGKTAHRISNTAEHDREHIEEIAAWRRARGV